MLVKYFINKLAEENLPEINRKLCIHGKSKYSECNYCVNACPEKVICSENGVINFDLSNCSRCGICKMVCPSQAIQLRSFGEGKILRSMEHHKEIIVSCEQHEALNTVTIPCLNGLKIEFLAYLATHHHDIEINLNLSKCKACNKNMTDDYILKTCSDLNDFLKDISINNNVLMTCDENVIGTKEKHVIDRRELLKLAKSTSFVSSKTILSDLWYGEEKSLNYKQKIAKKIVENANIGTLKKDNKIFGGFSVDESCNLCRFCVSICHRGAWKIDKKDQGYTLSHKSSLCDNCQVCLQGCRSKCIIVDSIETDELDVYNEKMRKSYKYCTGCRQEFVPNMLSDELCEICKKHNEIKLSIKNSFIDLKGE